MADVCNRTTARYIKSQDKSNYPIADWIHFDGDEATVLSERARILAIPEQYRNIVGDVVSEKSAAEKTTVDATVETNRRAAVMIEREWRAPDGKVWAIGIDNNGDRTKRLLT